MRCEDVLHPALWLVPFDELSDANVGDWITAHFSDAVVSQNGMGSFAWESNGKDFIAFLDSTYRYFAQYPGGRLQISPESTERQPTVADVLRCFGSPDLYAVRDLPAEVPQREFSMWYLSRGLIFETAGDKGFFPKKFDLTSRLNGPFVVVRPGSAEQMEAGSRTTDPLLIASLMAALKPWPEDFQVAE